MNHYTPRTVGDALPAAVGPRTLEGLVLYRVLAYLFGQF